MQTAEKIFEQEKNKRTIAYTVVTVSVLAVMLLLVSWTLPAKQVVEPDLGVEVNLGNSETGLGDVPPMVPGDPAPEAAEPTPAPSQSSPEVEEPISADDDVATVPDPVVLPKKNPVTTPKPKPVTNKTTVQNNTPKVNEQPAVKPAPKPKAQMGNYAGGTGTGGNSQDTYNGVKNQGIAGGTGDQGKANGNINSDNYTGGGGTGKSGVTVSRGLTGRSIVKLPSFEDDFNENAKIAVDIKVDESGRVISATFQLSGSSSSKASLKNIALKKARELKFSSGSGESIGTVVFNFKLK